MQLVGALTTQIGGNDDEILNCRPATCSRGDTFWAANVSYITMGSVGERHAE